MQITLVPYAGLCNRLNAILSGLAFKEKYPETELTILWHKWFHCNCHFYNLFKQLPSPYPPVNELGIRIKDIPGYKYNLNIPQFFRRLWYDGSVLPGDKADNFTEIVKGMNKVYVFHANRFCREEITSSIATIFQPIDELQDRINEITHEWEKQYVVGLHIRRTDNKASIKGSPDDFFYHAIEEEIVHNANVRFYVASDEEHVKQNLHNLYGNRIITIPLCLKRNSIKGMKDAVVDLYCLGRTRKIYGSKMSSYSTFAARLYNIEVIKDFV